MLGISRGWRMFDSDIPTSVREALLRAIITAYPQAWEGVQSFTSSTAHWLQPYHRHAFMRDTLSAIAQRFPAINADIRRTTPPTTTYVRLTSGVTVLTVASVQYPKTMPRWAHHRETLATNASNYELFKTENPNESGFLYGVVLCGPEVTSGAIQHVPVFVDVGIPAQEYGKWVHYARLYDEFPECVEEVVGVKPAEIRRAYIGMRQAEREEGRAS